MPLLYSSEDLPEGERERELAEEEDRALEEDDHARKAAIKEDLIVNGNQLTLPPGKEVPRGW